MTKLQKNSLKFSILGVVVALITFIQQNHLGGFIIDNWSGILLIMSILFTIGFAIYIAITWVISKYKEVHDSIKIITTSSATHADISKTEVEINALLGIHLKALRENQKEFMDKLNEIVDKLSSLSQD